MITVKKICSQCKQSKPCTEFGRAGKEKDGLRSECRDCRQEKTRLSAAANLERVRRWKEQNPEKVTAWKKSYKPKKRQTEKVWRDRNRSRKRAIDRAGHERHRKARNEKQRVRNAQPERTAYMRAWFDAHPGYKAANTRQWKARYPERAQASGARMAAKRRNAPGDLTAAQWTEILAFYDHACAQCRVPASHRTLTVDHFIPIAKGGAHAWHNVWPLCMPCNAKKHTTLPPMERPPHVVLVMATVGHKEATA